MGKAANIIIYNTVSVSLRDLKAVNVDSRVETMLAVTRMTWHEACLCVEFSFSITHGGRRRGQGPGSGQESK